MTNNKMQELEDEHGAELGDPRRCPRHPEVQTSSPDGMFDNPCGACEMENEEPAPVLRSNKTCSVCDRFDVVGGPKMVRGVCRGEWLCIECAQ